AARDAGAAVHRIVRVVAVGAQIGPGIDEIKYRGRERFARRISAKWIVDPDKKRRCCLESQSNWAAGGAIGVQSARMIVHDLSGRERHLEFDYGALLLRRQWHGRLSVAADRVHRLMLQVR